MVDAGDPAPDFTAPLAYGDGEIGPFTLSANLDRAPFVLAFFPGAFTSVCTDEMRAFDERLAEFGDAGATVLGVSVDTPFSLNRFREAEGLAVPMVSDHAKGIIDAYDVATDFEEYGYYGLADRAVFVVDADCTVTYRWLAADPGALPDLDEVLAAVEDAAE